MTATLLALALAAQTPTQPPAAADDPVLPWNEVVLQAIRADRTPPPMAARALAPHWANLAPFAVPHGARFRPPAPPVLTDPAYTAAFREVKRLGRKTGSDRTAEQTEIAYFWADGEGTVTPPGHWNRIARSA